MSELADVSAHPLASQYPCRTPVWWARHGDIGKDPGLTGVSGRMVLLRIPKQFKKLEGFLARLFKAPKELRRPLDEMNSMLWELCDGTRTFEQVCTVLNDVFKEEISPVLHRTTAAIRQFEHNNLMLMLEEPLNQRWFIGPGRVPEHQVLGPVPESLQLDTKPIPGEAP